MSWARGVASGVLALACVQASLPAARASSALHELLGLAVERCVSRLGREGGFGGNPLTRIELPAELGPLARALHGTGMGERVVALESALNRAAERATEELGPWLRDEAGRFVPSDPDAVLAGAPPAATRAFQAAVSAPLAERLRPAVERALVEAGANEALVRVREGASRLPLPRNAELDLLALTSQQLQATFFVVLAEEEAELRASAGDASRAEG